MNALRKAVPHFILAMTAVLWRGESPAWAADAPPAPAAKAPAASGPDRDIHVTGTNTLRLEEYFNQGDKASSPYPNSDTHWYDELSLNLIQRASPYDTRRGQLMGLMNQSKYRSDEKGFVLERLSLSQEKGDVLIPYRVEIGDYFNDISYRTQSRSLKGVQLELQPGMDWFGAKHSLLLFAGVDEPDWHRFHATRDQSTGASWLLSDMPIGDVSLNFILNARQRDSNQDLRHRKQHIMSVAWEKQIEFGEHKVTLEGEVGHFSGDYDVVTDEDNGQNKQENAYFGQVTWETPWSLEYRFRVERYGYGYRPYGGNVSPDRRSFENHLTWRLANGLQIALRQQRYEDGYDSNPETRTTVYGVHVSGPMAGSYMPDLTGDMDAFVRFTDSSDESSDSCFISFNWNVSKPVSKRWTIRPGFVFEHNHDRTAAQDPNEWTWQFNLAGDYAVDWGSVKGSLSPGMSVRLVRDDASTTSDFGPSLAAQLTSGPHSLGMDLSYLGQRRPRDEGGIDSEEWNASANYSYNWRNHTFGVEFTYRGLVPSPGEHSDAYEVALFWTMDFGFKVPVVRRTAGGFLPAAAAPAAAGPSYEMLAQLAPGKSLEEMTAYLASRGVRGYADLPNVRVFDVRLMPTINRRQRLAIQFDSNRIVTRAGLIIEFRNLGDPDTIRQTFAKVRSLLMKKFGNPSFFFERGEFTPALPADVSSGRFIRVYEWRTSSGVLRFGIPRRLDGRIRMEIQHARTFPPARQTLWSIEEVR